MFYDRDSLLDMYETTLEKSGWNYYLITLSSKDFESIEKMDIQNWINGIADSLTKKEAAGRLNNGNVFLVIHDDHIPIVLSSLKEKKIPLKNSLHTSTPQTIQYDIFTLSKEHSELLLEILS